MYHQFSLYREIFATSVRRTENVACRFGSHFVTSVLEPTALVLGGWRTRDIGNSTSDCYHRCYSL